MTIVAEPSVIIDYPWGHHGGERVLEDARMDAPVHASEVTRLEVPGGMGTNADVGTRTLASILVRRLVGTATFERAGESDRRWRASDPSIDGADPEIAAAVIVTNDQLVTRHVRRISTVQRPLNALVQFRDRTPRSSVSVHQLARHVGPRHERGCSRGTPTRHPRSSPRVPHRSR